MIIGDIQLKDNGEIYKSRGVLCQCEACTKTFVRNAILALRDSRYCKACITANYNRTRDKKIHQKMVENAAKTWRGKTRIEVCGIDKASAASLSQSLKNLGQNNPNFGGKYSRGFADRPLTGKWETVFGEEEANRRKAALRARLSGSGNPMFGKPSPEKSGNGISGWWRDSLYFRSLLELSFIIKCERIGKRIYSAEKKEYRIDYEFNGICRTYVPDFVDDAGNLYECKPKKLISSAIVKAKIKAAPHVIIVTDDELVRPTVEELKFLIESGDVIIDSTKMWRVK